jgi:hypothetical protein
MYFLRSKGLFPEQNQAQLFYLSTDRTIVRAYERELERRHISTQQIEASQIQELLQGSRVLQSAGIIFFSQQSSKDPDFVSTLYALTIDPRARAIGWRATLLITDPVEIPQVLRGLPRIHADYLDFDLAFEELLRFVFGQLPDWLQLYCRPSQMANPTGASWWTNDIVVADEYYGHVLRIKAKESSIVLAGLDEPYHLHLDRRCLLISHLGGNEVIVGRLQGGAIWNLWTVETVLGQRLHRPHGVFQGNNYSLIADTDNHRILRKQGDFAGTEPWESCEDIEVRFPCGVYGDDYGAWIADTFNHSVINVDFTYSLRFKNLITGGPESHDRLRFPVAICTWNNLIFISDEQNAKLRVFKRVAVTGEIVQVEEGLGAPFIGSPLGIAANRNSCLLVADRLRGCCWVINIKETPLLGDSSCTK